jgi:hypothetical protein
MHQFKDNQQRPWQISLNGWQLKKLKERLDFDARDHESIFKAAGDPELLCNILFVLCEEQAKTFGVTDEDFGKSLDGDAIDEATQAYLDESVDFFPQRQRQALRKVLATMKETIEKRTTKAEQKIDSPEMTELIDLTIQEVDLTIDETIAKAKTQIATRRKLLAGTTTGN